MVALHISSRDPWASATSVLYRAICTCILRILYEKTMSVCSGWYFWPWGVKAWLEHVWCVCEVLLTSRLFLVAPWRQLCSPWEITWCLEVTIAPSRCGTWRTWDLQLLPSAQTRPLIGKCSRLVRCKTASWECCYWTSGDNTVPVFRKFWEIEKLYSSISRYSERMKSSQASQLGMVQKIWIILFFWFRYI